MAYKLMIGFDSLVALVFLYFFVVGVGDGSVSSFNIVLWLGILALLAAVLIGGYKLHEAGRTKLALGVLAIVALPGLAYVLFFGAIIILQPRWN
ncbi:MAG: osmoprotectant transporter permease [Betaproteobacteria bacterium]|nr:osmoprotectant transporter permease [Betaproteobacteria bacterium]MDH5287809.1 osmoprotectant transporter permease [Betaproteobacteria bacterium]